MDAIERATKIKNGQSTDVFPQPEEKKPVVPKTKDPDLVKREEEADAQEKTSDEKLKLIISKYDALNNTKQNSLGRPSVNSGTSLVKKMKDVSKQSRDITKENINKSVKNFTYPIVPKDPDIVRAPPPVITPPGIESPVIPPPVATVPSTPAPTPPPKLVCDVTRESIDQNIAMNMARFQIQINKCDTITNPSYREEVKMTVKGNLYVVNIKVYDK